MRRYINTLAVSLSVLALSTWIGLKGFVFGVWLTYTPFAIWSLSIQLAQSWSAK